MKKRKKVLIYGLYDWDNLGDDLMMFCINSELKKKNIEARFIKSHNNNYFDEKYIYEENLQTDKICDNKLVNSLLKFWQVFKFNPKKQDYDALIFMGGGYINRSIGSGFGKLIYIYLLKRKFKKKQVFFSGQTVGPVNNFIDKIMLKKIYNHANVYVREKDSYNLLYSLGIKCTLSGDDAFLLKEVKDSLIDKDYFIVNFKSFYGYDYLFDNFKKVIVNIAKEKKLKVALLPFRNINTYDEYKIHQQLKELLIKENIEVELLEIRKVNDLISYIKNCRFMIGTAYHFVTLGIFLNKKIYTGYIGKYYQTKIEGIINLTNYSNVECYNLEKDGFSKILDNINKNNQKDNQNDTVEGIKKAVYDEWNNITNSILKDK